MWMMIFVMQSVMLQIDLAATPLHGGRVVTAGLPSSHTPHPTQRAERRHHTLRVHTERYTHPCPRTDDAHVKISHLRANVRHPHFGGFRSKPFLPVADPTTI
jgi:hypothetical protein